MGAVSTPLAERVTSLFDDLGYTVSGTGSQLRAERKWRVVDISLGRPDSIPANGEFHCFVARQETALEVYRDVASADPGYEWAVLRVGEDGDVEFLTPGHRDGDTIVT